MNNSITSASYVCHSCKHIFGKSETTFVELNEYWLSHKVVITVCDKCKSKIYEVLGIKGLYDEDECGLKESPKEKKTMKGKKNGK